MTKIDLTPEELREFARLSKVGPARLSAKKADRWWVLARKINTELQSSWDQAHAASLALALADAMEERDRLRRELEEARAACCWSEDDDGNWDTGCGRMFVLNDGTPSENEMRYCCFCGHTLDEHIPTVRAAYAEEHTMGTVEGWTTRRKNAERNHTQQIDAAYNLGLGRGYENGRASLADLIGQLQAIAVTAEKLCKVDGSGSKIGRMPFFDAMKAATYSERLWELLTEWRKGQKEKRW